MRKPTILVIAGPNGSGKSTFIHWYVKYRQEIVEIVDPDAIARELKIDSETSRQMQAGRAALQRIDRLIASRLSFAIETTLSGKSLADRLRTAANHGFTIEIVLLKLSSVNTSSERVSGRVAQGGHDIPYDVQLRRFDRCYTNFHEFYRSVCHVWTIYDNESQQPRKLDAGRGGLSSW